MSFIFVVTILFVAGLILGFVGSFIGDIILNKNPKLFKKIEKLF